jgi:hypothetical protein
MITMDNILLPNGLTTPIKLMKILERGTVVYYILHPSIYSYHKLSDFPIVNTQAPSSKQSNTHVEIFTEEIRIDVSTAIIKGENS